ncbi:hypothetical protein SS1G_13400 [Sclerotinia sclerotiorum 1980 UF-70]|uniref:F-actin-capping protein subunit alpha n=1 Tax=Sclerotinia sclerotiorum (strain ATCC 18683 / 1980 / Ss-1) TaxID=665079 RepID=A7F720_SCLS1|nr:hypothetical protein SS1G_13400 [Sclerotinia sclerotiorum 1980 UF-70]EDN98541.1 hypothetical protein SS1G_13400 [Sclerotinia sclerotiorum 1980 UF-70]
MSSQIETISAFVEGAPPGELADVIADIKALTIDTPHLVSELGPAFERYNEEQFTTVKLPGSSQNKASAVQSHVLEGSQADFVKSILKSLGPHVAEHFPNASYGAFPIENDSKTAILVVANKYSPNNFWNGRWRSLYIYDTLSSSLTGSIKVDVHYYEDGNVRLLTTKPISATSLSSASSIVREIAAAEKKYQEEINKGFNNLSEGAFKGLRRQLPITRQKIEWDKIAGYRLGQDIGGGTSRR